MAMVSSLLWIPNYRGFVVVPVTILRTLSAATSHRHYNRHKNKRFGCSNWDSDLNFYQKNCSRTFASDSVASIAITSNLSTPNSKWYSISSTSHRIFFRTQSIDICTIRQVICNNYLYTLSTKILKIHNMIEMHDTPIISIIIGFCLPSVYCRKKLLAFTSGKFT